MKKLILFAVVSLLMAGCSKVNLEDVRANAGETFARNGFTITGYQGYQYGVGIGDYNGAIVWYSLKKDGSNIMYQAALRKWGNEYHIYNITAIDAIKPKTTD